MVSISPPQNSRDNMSVVLVTFPGAPTVSQEAIEKVSNFIISFWTCVFNNLLFLQDRKLQQQTEEDIDKQLKRKSF